MDPLLEQVGASGRSRLEQREHVARLRVLAEHDDTDLGAGLPQQCGDLNALVALRRWHADVGHYDVRTLVLDASRREGVLADRDHVDLRLGSKHLLEAFPHEKAVVGKNHPDRHGKR